MSAPNTIVDQLVWLTRKREALESMRSVPGFDDGLNEAQWEIVASEIANIEAEEQALVRELRVLLPVLAPEPCEPNPLDCEDDDGQ